MVVKINNKSDFKINEWSESIALEVPFEFIYYIPLNKEKYVASYDGHSYINCVRLADGSLDVIFNNHGLGIGRLKVVRKYFVDDLSFADGVFDVISDDQTDVFLTSGKTFDTYVKTLVVPPYLKGDKGDPMTWETMTEKERGELVKDIAEAIDPEMVMTENEKLRQEAEQGRQTAEQQRSTTFNTLKGEMQSAITAGNAAAGNAQKVVDEYDEKVSEQDSKLSELGSYVEWVKDFDLDLSFVSREAGYWRVDGTLNNQNDLWHTKPIKINKGSIFVGTEFSSTDSISIITQVLEDGDFVKTLLIGSNNKDSYSYEFDEDCFVSISYGSTLKIGEAIIKIKGEIEDIRELVKYNSEEVIGVKESLFPLLGGKLDFSDIKWENDKAVKPIGISNTIGYYLSEPIKVFCGTIVKANGVLATSIIAISKTDSEGNIKELLLQGQGSGITEYNWVAESECYIRISSTTKVGSITHKSVETTLEEHSETLNRIVNSYTIDLSTLLIIDGFINVNGTANSNSGFYRTNPIKVYKGDVVEVTTNTTSSISLVSKVNQDGSYTSVLSGSENKTYQWVADEECNIVISTIKKVGSITHKSVESILEEHSETLNHIDVELEGLVIDAYKQGLLDKAWKTDGTLGYSGSFSRSNVIEVKNGDTVYLDGIGATDLISVITRTDVNGEYIGTLVIGKNGGGLYTYKCPFDGYIVISSSTVKFKEGVAIVTRKGIKDKLEEVGKSFWTGKRIMAIGASLCASTDTRNWQYVMGDILGCNIRTHAKGGIGLIQMVDGDGTEKPEADPDNFGVNNIYPLEDSDVEDVDLILIFGAYNEYRRALNEYGTMNDIYPEQNTFLGRLRYVANKLTNLTLSANKECRIAFISTYCFGGGSYCNSTGYIAGEKILDGFKEVGKEFSIPVIDLLHEGQISKYNWDTFCSGAGKENTTYLPYDESVPYGVPSIFPSISDLPSSAQEGIVALVQSDNEYGYVYSQYKDGAWKHNIWPWSSGSYPPYMYLWKDFIHLNFDGHNRVAQYIAKQVNTL